MVMSIVLRIIISNLSKVIESNKNDSLSGNQTKTPPDSEL